MDSYRKLWPVGFPLLRRAHLCLDDAHREAQEPQDASHPGGIATGQVVIGGDHMHSITLKFSGIYLSILLVLRPIPLPIFIYLIIYIYIYMLVGGFNMF